MIPAPPPRLHVVTATGCDKALVLRRGPKAHVLSCLWHRATNEIERGQWLVGRVYEHRCDLSPDGAHMVIFARNQSASTEWTAVSRTPWFTAVAFWQHGSTWMGGGAFDAHGRLWLNGADAQQEHLPDGLRAAAVDAFPHSTDGFHMGDLYAAMMRLRGWQHYKGTRYDTVLRKPISDGWQLELTFALRADNRGLISNRFALVHPDRQEHFPQADWEWAEPFNESVQFAKAGALWQAPVAEETGIAEPTMLHDFTPMTFEAIKAPYQGISSRSDSR